MNARKTRVEDNIHTGAKEKGIRSENEYKYVLLVLCIFL
jgi:hypothetical protein